MQNKSLMHPAYSSRRIISISIGILSTLLLASCGGGGLSDPSATAQSAEESMKTIQAVSGSTAVSGTWTGRAPKMEVINGITVPPEPAPAINNATLAGVDINNNGIRDDVERLVAKSFSDSPAKLSEATSFVKAEQAALNNPSADNIAKYTREVDCSKMPAKELNVLTYALLNTQARRRAYAVANAGATGGECIK